MDFTVQKIDIVVDKRQGYAFIDKHDNCIMITYGEANVKIWTQLFKDD